VSLAKILLLAPPLLGIMAPIFLKYHIYTPSETTYHLLGSICHQEYSRCFWIAGAPVGICARCSGIYIGTFLSTFSDIINHKSQVKYTIVVFCMLPLIIEKTAFIGYPTTNIIRLIVGVMTGYGVGIVLLSLTNKLIISFKTQKGRISQ